MRTSMGRLRTAVRYEKITYETGAELQIAEREYATEILRAMRDEHLLVDPLFNAIGADVDAGRILVARFPDRRWRLVRADRVERLPVETA